MKSTHSEKIIYRNVIFTLLKNRSYLGFTLLLHLLKESMTEHCYHLYLVSFQTMLV